MTVSHEHARLRHPEAWGRHPRAVHDVVVLERGSTDLPVGHGLVLPFGNGRSYGDSCLNDGGTLLWTRERRGILAFDSESGRLVAEAGALLCEIISLAQAHGWFLPVVPGTQFVTVGGAIANDIHGKNHHVAGTFGCHVSSLILLRSDGSRTLCSGNHDSDLFRATIGGLGLTGLIQQAEIQLVRAPTPWVVQEVVRFGNLSEFFTLSAESDHAWPATVAWIDCTGLGQTLGRGVFIRGMPAAADTTSGPEPSTLTFNIPFTPPVSLVNRLSMLAFNTAYWHRAPATVKRSLTHYQPFYFPLDTINNWNRMYGPKGFLQWQCVLPPDNAEAGMTSIITRIARSRLGSFLAVLKHFGAVASPGMLSFPRPGATLALDFPNSGESLGRLLDELDEIVNDSGGAIYPAKDARMSAATFRRGFPQWEEFSRYIDPRFSSSFWRRVSGTSG